MTWRSLVGRPQAVVVAERDDMNVPGGDSVFASRWLAGVLESSPAWGHGRVRALSATRIGVEHGLSGRIDRVSVETERGEALSVVVKQESAAAVERELLFRRRCGELVGENVPALLFGESDARAERGVLVFEDVTPAAQGDVLHGCTTRDAEAVVRVLGRLHRGSWSVSGESVPAGLPRWRAQPMERDRWRDRLARAGERFPAILGSTASSRMLDLPARVADAGEALGRGPVSWIHGDAHLDNILYRPDGTPVLLDWCNAAIGPPAVDLARFVSEGVAAPSQPARVARIRSAYLAERRRTGVDEDELGLDASFALALLPLLQGAVGWAGRDDLAPGGRSAALCEHLLRGVCAWTLGDEGVDEGALV